MNSPLPGEGSAVKIYWDEYFHGQRSSLWSYARKTPVAWGLVQIAVLGLVVFFTFGRRSGPVMLPPVVSRLSPLAFVDTLGGLYEPPGAGPAAVGFGYQRFPATLSRQLGFPPGTSQGELRAAGAAPL